MPAPTAPLKNGRAARQFWGNLVITSLSLIGGVLLMLLGPDETTRHIGSGLLGMSGLAGVGLARGKSNLAVLLVPLLLFAGCGTPWLVSAKRSLIGAKAGADATRHVSSTVFHSRCMEVAKQCKVAPPNCAPLTACQGDRRKFNDKLAIVYRSLDAARALLEAAALATVPGEFKDRVLAVVVKALAEYRALMKLAESLGVFK